MASSFWLLFSETLFIVLISCNFSPSSAFSKQSIIHVSTISAAPTVLPSSGSADPPSLVSSPSSSPPSLSPDIEPLFPTPGSGAFTPSESSLPTIPSSPSPPNPDSLGGSVSAFPPEGSPMMPAAAPSSHAESKPKPLYSILQFALVGFCIIMQFHGM